MSTSEYLSPRSRVLEWFKRFQDGRDNVEDGSRSGLLSTLKTDENIEKVGNLVRSDRRLSICAIAESIGIEKDYHRLIIRTIAESIGINKECVSWLLHQDNAPAHSALSVKRFLVKFYIIVLDHPFNSPELVPCDFYLFPNPEIFIKRKNI
ncbi:hypothetical protein O3M35_010998 [Rhynocoris fuscipes]|uniref:Transposase n=1 Tax=Rhynocoris fuscipes TaxID=488301 RepID=A0AAW1D749_9HEMI